MKALCNREGLLTAFGMVSGVVPTRSPKPILQNIKLVADPDEGSILMATDLEVGIRHRVMGMKVEQPGSVILPTARVGSILRTSSDDDKELALEADGDHLVDPGPALGVQAAGRGPEPLPRGPRLRRDELPRDQGGRPAEADPPHDLRHRRREHAVRRSAACSSS